MVTLARQLRGWTQNELATAAGVAQGTISKIELGYTVSDDLIQELAAVIDVPAAFLYQQGDIYAPGMKYQRARKAVPKKSLDQQDAYVNVIRMHIEKLLMSCEVAVDTIRGISYSDYESPEHLAKGVREALKMPTGPISNLTTLIENAGAIIAHVDFGTRVIDGVTHSRDKLPPMIFVNQVLPGDRMRFTIAHELGHAIMHSEKVTANGVEAEQDADRFASEFLMPARDIRSQLTNLDFAKLALLKKHWKVSMAALIRRARDVRTITEYRYRTLNQQLSKNGWKTTEPPDLAIDVEKPGLIREMINVHLQYLGFSLNDLADVLCIHPHELIEMYDLPKPSNLRLVQTTTSHG